VRICKKTEQIKTQNKTKHGHLWPDQCSYHPHLSFSEAWSCYSVLRKEGLTLCKNRKIRFWRCQNWLSHTMTMHSSHPQQQQISTETCPHAKCLRISTSTWAQCVCRNTERKSSSNKMKPNETIGATPSPTCLQNCRPETMVLFSTVHTEQWLRNDAENHALLELWTKPVTLEIQSCKWMHINWSRPCRLR